MGFVDRLCLCVFIVVKYSLGRFIVLGGYGFFYFIRSMLKDNVFGFYVSFEWWRIGE